MGEHRNHSVHKIHTCTSFVSLAIQRAFFLYIVCHIRDMHSQFIVLSLFRQGDCIVQIFCIFSVNRHHLPVTDIHSPCHVCRTDIFCHTLCLIQHLFRKFNWKIVPFYNGHNICPRIIDMPDNLHNLSFRLFIVSPIFRKFHNYFVSGDCSFRAL